MFYLTMHSTHFIYSYMASDIWLRTILIVRKETCCHHIGYSFRLTARILLYAPSHRQDSTYHSLCYTSHGALAGTRNSSMGPPWRIDPTTHRTMSERSYHGATSRSGGKEENVHLKMHSLCFIYGYNLSDIWLKTSRIMMKDTPTSVTSLAARDLLHAPSYRLE